jgi:hypothetical protein
MRQSFLVLLAAAGCQSQLAEQPAELPLDTVFRIELDGTLVDAVVTQSEFLTIDTQTSWRGQRNVPNISHEVTDGVLRITGECAEIATSCEVVHVLGVPDDVLTVLDLDRGNVLIDGANRTELGLFGGDVQLQNLRGSHSVSLIDGSILGTELAPDELSLTTDGSVDLSFGAPPSLLQIDAGASVLLSVPGGAYRLGLDAGLGGVFTEGVFHSDDAGSTLDVASRAGQIIVRGR